MRTAIGLFAAIIMFFGGVWVYDNLIKNEWIGIYESRTSNQIYTLDFSSKEACVDWVTDKRSNPGGYTNYECGRNCQAPTTANGLYVCKETL